MPSASCRWRSPAASITEDSSLEQNRRQASALIFHSGLSTAAEPAGRGLGMRILRDNVKRLHGQIQVATKRGLFTRLRIRLPLAGMDAMPSTAASGLTRRLGAHALRLTQRVDAEHPGTVGDRELLAALATSAAAPLRRTASGHRWVAAAALSRHSVRR